MLSARLGAVLPLFSALVLAQALPAPAALQDKIERILAAPAAQRAAWGIHVVDLASGRELFARDAQVPMTPASNTKLFSTAIALRTLGPNYRFETRLLGPKPLPNGHLPGDLRLVGGGDPSLSGRVYPFRQKAPDNDPFGPLGELADQLAATGVRVIDGDLIADDSRWPFLPYPGGWSVGDLPWEYGAAVSALVFNDNVLKLVLRPGAKPGDLALANLDPALDTLTLHNTLVTDAFAPRKIEVDALPGSSVLQIYGTTRASLGPSTYLLSAGDPARFAADALALLLRQRGITLRGSIRAAHRLPGRPYLEPQGELLARRLSPPLSELATAVNKVSQNLHAEMLLREAGFKDNADGSAASGHRVLADWLKALNVDDRAYSFEDGSGLSRKTLIAPSVLTAILQNLHWSDLRDTFWATLPIAGEDGTLSARFRAARSASSIRAKTGSLSHVAALSGYAGLDPARRLAFSIICNGFASPSAEIRELIDRLALAIEEESRR